MRRERFQLNTEQIEELWQAFKASRDGQLRTRLLALRLYGTGYSIGEVLHITGCSRTSLMDWSRLYKEKGVSGLLDRRRGGNRAKLTAEQIEELKERLNRETPRDVLGQETAGSGGRFWTVEDLRLALEKWFHVVYESRSSYLRLFDLCGFSYRRSIRAFVLKSKTKADLDMEIAQNKD